LRSRFMSLARVQSKRTPLIVTLLSFGFKHGVPLDADLVFDVRFLPNPHFVPELKPLTGKSLAEVAKMRGTDPIETIMDLIAEDESRIDTIYFLMSEENVRKELAKPWISFGSDEASQAPEGVFLKSNPHPRAYGNFARVLGKYAREEKLVSLGEAIRRLSALPATNLGLDHRGYLKEGMFADVVVFDPATVGDRATYAQPHQYTVGMKHVFVNGTQVLKDGEHTGATPGRALWGPGKTR